MKTLILLLIPHLANAQAPSRITAIHFDKGKVERIYMAPGLATAVTFPCDLDEATTGRDEDLKAKVSPTSKRQLTLNLSNAASLPTNLIVRCGDRQELFVFDVIPSRKSHQDVVRITGTYGGAERRDDHAGGKLQLIDDDQKAKELHEAKKQKRRINPATVVEVESSDTWKPKAKVQRIVEKSAPQEIIPEPAPAPKAPEPEVALAPEVKALDQKRQTAIMVQKPQLVEENQRQEAREEFKRALTGVDLKPEEQK